MANFFTRPNFEDRQMVQYSGDSITLSGVTMHSNRSQVVIQPGILDFTGTTTGQSTTTINGLTGYLNDGRLLGLVVQPTILLISGGTGTTTTDVTGMVLTSLDSKGTVYWAPSSGTTGTGSTKYLSSAGLNCGNNILTLSMSDATNYTVDFTCIVTGSTSTDFTGNTSGSCITDLWVTNIHGCSPLNINPLDEGNVIFGFGDKVTIDIDNGGNLYINGDTFIQSDTKTIGDLSSITSILKGPITVFDSPLSVGGLYSNSNISGNTGIFFGTYDNFPTTNNSGSLAYYGSGYTSSGSPTVGTSFYKNKIVLAGANDVSGMVIKPQTGADSTTLWWEANGNSTMILQSELILSGVTGYLGLALNPDGTELPDHNLQIGGTFTSGTFKFVDGNQQSGYVLTSDSGGTATWQASTGGGGVSIDPYEVVPSNTTVNWDVSGTSTNYQTILTGNTTLNLNNVRNGDYGTIILEQDTTGSHTLSFGTVNGVSATHRVVNGGGGSPTLTINPNAIDIASFTYNGSALYWTVGNDYT